MPQGPDSHRASPGGGALAIAQVTPFAWEAPHEVNRYVAALADELARRGERVLIVAPSRSSALVRESRKLIRAARERPGMLLARAEGRPLVLGVGEVLPFAPARRRAASLPIDVSRTIEETLAQAPLDIVHVHEPFGPSAASAALRHSHSLNVGSFHSPTERVLSTQLARRVTELFLARLDLRTASYRATRDLLQRYIAGDYRIITPGAPAAPGPPRREPSSGPVEVAFVAGEERAALRLLLRALRRIPPELDWRATIELRFEGEPATALRREVRERVRYVTPGDRGPGEPDALHGADIAVLASTGIAPTPDALLGALAAGAVPVAARLPVYEEILHEGAHGLLFEPGDAETLAAQLQRLIGDARLRARLRDGAQPLRETLTFARVADDFELGYRELTARRHGDRTTPAVRSRLAGRELIDVDLHMHTDHSHDCATPVEALLATARERGLGAIAVTDHNEISGARDAAAKSDGIKVIIGEEVKTADQGEVIGLFIERRIERGMTLAETIAEIKRQGGLVYVPHPFDRLHSVPDYEHLLGVVELLDAIEVFNPRVAINEFNEEAVRFADKYRIIAGAGSDAHVVQGLGSVRIRMRDFDGPEEFLASLREADIIRRPKRLLYVQALKFLQTKAAPAPTRRAARERRVRRSRAARRKS